MTKPCMCNQFVHSSLIINVCCYIDPRCGGPRGSCREQLQAGAVDADDPDHTGDAVLHHAARRQRVAQCVQPGEQPGDQGHWLQHLRLPAAGQLPHRLRLVRSVCI
jgi:hypothetical protein